MWSRSMSLYAHAVRATPRFVRVFSANATTILSLESVTKRLSAERTLFENVTVSFQKGAKIGLLGPNGVGKSSLLKIIAGVDKDFEGEVRCNRHTTVAYLSQEPELTPTLNVRDNIRNALQKKFDILKRYDDVSNKFSDPNADYNALIEEQSCLQQIIDASDLWNLERRIDIAINALRCPPPETKVTGLSGGERRRVALCGLLLQEADVLLLDEPTNHLDTSSVAWLEQYLTSYKGTVIAVTHDRYFLDNTANFIAEIERGTLIANEGNYSSYLVKRSIRREIQAKENVSRSSQMEKELQWIRRGGKKMGNKARMKNYEELKEKSVFEARVDDNLRKGKLVIPPGPKLGNKVVKLVNVSKSFNARRLIKDLTLTLEPGSVVGVVGGNGIGKSTLLRMIAGQLEPDEGKVKLGKTVQIGFVTQSRQELNEEDTIAQAIVPDLVPVRVSNVYIQARHYVAQFNFRGSVQDKLVKFLSGGERNRVHLAKILRPGCNLLLMDEPTNDLDIETLRALEEGLQDFPGCAIVVSHDRWFLDRICTHIISFEGNAVVKFSEGNYTEFCERKQKMSKTATKSASVQ